MVHTGPTPACVPLYGPLFTGNLLLVGPFVCVGSPIAVMQSGVLLWILLPSNHTGVAGWEQEH